jgi:hypothetical protein
MREVYETSVSGGKAAPRGKTDQNRKPARVDKACDFDLSFFAVARA